MSIVSTLLKRVTSSFEVPHFSVNPLSNVRFMVPLHLRREKEKDKCCCVIIMPNTGPRLRGVCRQKKKGGLGRRRLSGLSYRSAGSTCINLEFKSREAFVRNGFFFCPALEKAGEHDDTTTRACLAVARKVLVSLNTSPRKPSGEGAAHAFSFISPEGTFSVFLSRDTGS